MNLFQTNKRFTNILGVHIFATDYAQVVQKIQTAILSHQHAYVSVAAVHLVMECKKDQQPRLGVNQSLVITPDGMPLVWLSRLAGQKVERVYGPQLMIAACLMAQEKKFRVFLLGG